MGISRLAVASFSLASDRLSKEWALLHADRLKDACPFPWLRIELLKNKGVCFGVLSKRADLVQKVTAGVAAWITLRSLCRRNRHILSRLSDGLLVGGAWGNVSDRLLRGHIVDFMQIRCKNERLDRLTFNLADVWIAAGILLRLPVALLGLGKR